jgi:prepilin-type N-terminal cleavage/methylation domain-containing protein
MTRGGAGLAAPDQADRSAVGIDRPVERAPVFVCLRADGFTLIELLVSTAITLGLMATLFGLTSPAQGMFDAQPELSDMQQRLRAGVDALTKDLLMAQLPVMPYRVGRRNPDPALGIFFRPDTISVVSVPWQEEEIRSHTYYLRSDVAAGVFQLRHYDGAATDLPVVDHVVKLEFEYFGADQMRLDPSRLQDGPWYPDGGDANRFDADLLSIRRVRVVLRVQAARAALRGPAGVLFVHGGTAVSRERYLPDREIRFDVSPRNLNLAR